MKLRKLILTALFISLSFIGANIKIVGSIAFDSMPGFLGALILGPVYGAIIGALGHFLTALTSGFYMSLPVHIIIMVGMAITMYAFGWCYKIVKSKPLVAIISSSLIAVLINGPITILMIIPIMGNGILVMIPILSLVAFLNVLIAHICYNFFPRDMREFKGI